MKKLLLINPVVKNTGCTFNEPLALGIIARMSIAYFDIELIDENYEEFKYYEADLVAMTATTFSINRAIEISQEYLKNNIPVIIGGIHVSSCPEIHYKYFSSIVKGNAEDVWDRVIEDFNNNNLQKLYYFTSQNKEIISPQRDLFLKYNYPASSIETSRGCPNNCDFCCVNSFYKNCYFERPINEIIEEIKTIKNKIIFFVDDNFVGNLNKTERLQKLINELIPLKIKWYAFSTMNISNYPQLLKLFKRSGCVMLFIGFETTDFITIQSINKKVNFNTFNIYKLDKCIKMINNAGIGVMGGFIYGFDTENIYDIKARLLEVLESQVNWFSISILTPLPGSPFFDRLIKENRIIKNNFPEDWTHYNYCKAVFEPKKITSKDLDKFFIDSFSMCYNKKNTYKRFLKTLLSLKSIKQTYFFYLWIINHYRHITKYYLINRFMFYVKKYSNVK